ncbi:MAG: hypothetical protein DYG98_04780 [Haliscomenobacteraceae bacterium CHB4]|nr:hypothetical protein [Haliscomenobacteraceae bacterium CHB4]
MQQYALLTFFVVILLSLSTPACKHEPVLPGGSDPTDTTDNPIDTTGNPGGVGVPCDPDSVYFQNQILPILVSNCTESGCHNTTDHQDGVILTSYQSLMSTVENVTDNNWDENKLMKVLLEDDPDDRMPYNKAPLPQTQINLIAAWIQQGAKNNGCNENYGACETTNVQYSAFVRPLIQARCQGCHSGNAPQGGINLSTYANVKSVASNGKLYAAVTRTADWMPKGGTKLDQCTIDKLKAWIDAGAPEN